jgi:hypothetical protein
MEKALGGRQTADTKQQREAEISFKTGQDLRSRLEQENKFLSA